MHKTGRIPDWRNSVEVDVEGQVPNWPFDLVTWILDEGQGQPWYYSDEEWVLTLYNEFSSLPPSKVTTLTFHNDLSLPIQTPAKNKASKPQLSHPM